MDNGIKTTKTKPKEKSALEKAFAGAHRAYKSAKKKINDSGIVDNVTDKVVNYVTGVANKYSQPKIAKKKDRPTSPRVTKVN